MHKFKILSIAVLLGTAPLGVHAAPKACNFYTQSMATVKNLSNALKKQQDEKGFDPKIERDIAALNENLQSFLKTPSNYICAQPQFFRRAISSYKLQLQAIKNATPSIYDQYPARCARSANVNKLSSVIGIYQPLNRKPAVISLDGKTYIPTFERMGCVGYGEDCVITTALLGRHHYRFYQDTIDDLGVPNNQGSKKIVCIDLKPLN